MAKTNYQIFNEENAPERTYNDSEYKEATQRVGGVMPGMALSRMHNKMYYQWSAMCKAIANLIVSHGHDCMDNDVEGITRYLEEAITSAATGGINAHRTAAELDHPDGSVTTPKLRDAAVTGVKIADGVIDKKHLAADVKTLISDAGIAILGRNRSYQVGDIAYHKALPSWARLECVKAGTTGATLPNLSDARENDHITDGTVEWGVGKTATLEQLTKSLTGKADCSLGNILESAKTVINDAVIVRSLLAENGYIVFANGLIIQWGCVYGEQVTTPNQSILITPLVSISKELFSCGNVNVAGGNTDYNWKNNHAIVSTIYSQGDKKLSVSSTFFGKTYITRWLLIGV
ncbi:hypothetical protein [Selenomonas sp. oral taxon 149]|uniref:hypothetical protein n=1 Tax=Selenomonas sp. oral taxon 149 TaxID=712535 RepID=UPI0001E0D332|nr:hypothetical protein [Selenomonas sp. oral taxon 149]EFM23115.1 hypothetical protein HMPREF9166_1234 [Selenomonas sp. oral taxon 149 str. 67H29BP]